MDISIVDDHTGAVISPTVLRPGAVSIDELKRATGVEFFKSTSSSSDHSKNGHEGQLDQDIQRSAPKAPGMKYRHYAPVAPVQLVERVQLEATIASWCTTNIDHRRTKRIGILAKKSICEDIQALASFDEKEILCVVCGDDETALAFGRELYSALRAFDDEGVNAVHPSVDLIIAVPPLDRKDGIGEAVMNRLSKAAAGRNENVTAIE